jgi:hypothetical protein
MIVGALLDAVSMAFRNLPEVKLASLPRMADFARWVTAAEPALGWQSGAFLAAYYRNRGAAHELAIEADSVAAAVIEFMKVQDDWEGAPSTLLQCLSALMTDQQLNQRDWPKAAHSLSSRLKPSGAIILRRSRYRIGPPAPLRSCRERRNCSG